MAVRIRMKMMGRRHRPFFRIVAADSRMPRDGKVLEELGTYDPMIRQTDDRVRLNAERIKYWLSVGALPSEKVGFLLKKYLDKAPSTKTASAKPAAQEVPPADDEATDSSGDGD